MRNHLLVLFCLLWTGTFKVQAQAPQQTPASWLGVQIPPNPQVWQFATYGNEEQNLYTGTVSTTVPIYTYKDPDFEIPISLDYSSNGYRPNQQASSTGLGWAIKAGGYITRKVVGIRDDQCPNPSFIQGYYTLFKHGSRQVNQDVFNKQEYNKELGWYYGYLIYRSKSDFFGRSGSNLWIEPTPDQFTFNFQGHTGQFMMEARDTVLVYNANHPRGEYKVDLSKLVKYPGQGIYSTQDDSCISIITGDGYTYKFERKGVMGANEVWDPEVGSRFEYLDTPRVYWPLTEITAPNGRKATFVYGPIEYSDNFQWYTDFYNETLGRDERQLPFCYMTREHVSQLQKIIIDSVEITFDYTTRTPEVHSYNETGPHNLSSVKKLTKITVLEKKHDLKLKTCTFSYEYAKGNPVLFLKQVNIPGDGIYSFDYYDLEKKFPGHATVYLDHWGYYNIQQSSEPSRYWGDNLNLYGSFVYPTLYINNNNEEVLTSDCKDPNFEAARMGMLKSIIYPTGGQSSFEYEPHSYRAKVTRDRAHNDNQFLKKLSADEIAGGVRIHSITEYPDPARPEQFTNRTYNYAYISSDGARLDNSGILLHSPRYSRGLTLPRIKSCNQYKYPEDNYHIGYSEVQEIFQDSGSQGFNVYHFSNYSEFPDRNLNPAYTKKSGDEVYPGLDYDKFPFANYDADADSYAIERGKLMKTRKYDSNGKIKLTIENFHTDPQINSYEITTFKNISLYFYASHEIVREKDIAKKIVTEYTDNGAASTSHEYTYNDLGQITSEIVRQCGRAIKHHVVEYPYDAPKTSIINAMFKLNVMSYPLLEYSRQGNTFFDLKKYTYAIYPGLELPGGIAGPRIIRVKEIHEPKSSTVSPLTNLERTATFKYNSYGRITEATDFRNTPTCYLWGSDNLIPIAVGKNASLEDVKAKLGTTEVDKMTLDIEAKLRSIPFSEFTTYDYLPHYGIISITNPRGQKTSYEYNNDVKLRAIVDPRSEYIYQYHYSTDK